MRGISPLYWRFLNIYFNSLYGLCKVAKLKQEAIRLYHYSLDLLINWQILERAETGFSISPHSKPCFNGWTALCPGAFWVMSQWKHPHLSFKKHEARVSCALSKAQKLPGWKGNEQPALFNINSSATREACLGEFISPQKLAGWVKALGRRVTPGRMRYLQHNYLQSGFGSVMVDVNLSRPLLNGHITALVVKHVNRR